MWLQFKYVLIRILMTKPVCSRYALYLMKQSIMIFTFNGSYFDKFITPLIVKFWFASITQIQRIIRVKQCTSKTLILAAGWCTNVMEAYRQYCVMYKSHFSWNCHGYEQILFPESYDV